MVIRAVIDIDPADPVIQELSALAFGIGIFDVAEALTIYMKTNDWSIHALLVNAIFNFLSWKYESFEIELPTKTLERTYVSFPRYYSPEHHRNLGERYLSKAKETLCT